MASPFPGVDPFLESQHYWQDFHATFVNYWREAVSDALPDHYEARLDERVQIVGLDAREDRVILPDVSVVQKGDSDKVRGQAQDGGLATVEAVTLELPVMGEVRETLIEILHRPERSLVTVLELLSPTNKTNPGRGQYLSKRMELFTQPVHMVEVDLLLGGERLPMRRPLPAGDFYAIVSRAERRRTGQVYAWTVRDKLPALPVPLLKPDRDVLVDLGAVFATAYERGKFGRSIDYKAELAMPLEEGKTRWAQERARAAFRGRP